VIESAAGVHDGAFMNFPNLNRRHKLVLFFTVVVMGVTLLRLSQPNPYDRRIHASLVEVLGPVAGEALLGIALAWVVGSKTFLRVALSGITHAILILLGIGLFTLSTVPWLRDKNELRQYKRRVALFESRLPELAKRYPIPVLKRIGPLPPQSAEKPNPPGAESTAPEQPKPGEKYQQQQQPTDLVPIDQYRQEMLERGTLLNEAETQGERWVSEGRNAGIDLYLVPKEELPGVPPHAVSLWDSITWSPATFIAALSGVAVFVLGMSLTVRRYRRQKANRQPVTG